MFEDVSFGIGVKCINVFEPFERSLIGYLVCFAHQVINRDLQYVRNFNNDLNGWHNRIAFIVADDVAGSADTFAQLGLGDVFLLTSGAVIFILQ